MLRISSFILSAAVALSAPAHADEFNAKQKAEIGDLVRAYLLENPEILPQAIEALRVKETRAAIAAAGPALYSENGAVLMGPKNASVTIVEFYDYQCGYCQRSLSDIEAVLRSDKDVNVLFRQLPIRDKGNATHSYDSAKAALAAARQDEDFLAFHKALYASPTRLTEERIFEIAQDSGLNVKQLKKDMNDPLLGQALQQNLGLAALLGIRGTPGYVIGNQIIPGAEGYESLVAAVRAARDAG